MLILLQIQRKEKVEYHIHSFIYPKLSKKDIKEYYENYLGKLNEIPCSFYLLYPNEIKEAENGKILDIESSIRYNFYKENFKPWIDLPNRRVYVEVF